MTIRTNMRHARILRNESGFSLLDVLVAVSVLAIVLVAVNIHSTTAFKSYGKLKRELISNKLARDKLEEMLALNPAKLDDSYDSIELGLGEEGAEFTREVDITVQSDELRLIRVVVRPMSGVDAETVFEATLALRRES